jgi:ADP-heptose:LPS heptosyltransferase
VRVFVLRVAALGDTVCTVPLVGALVAAGHHVTVCAPGRLHPLLPSGVTAVDSDGALGSALYAGRADLSSYDVAVAWTSIGGDALRACGARDVRVGAPRPRVGQHAVDMVFEPVADLVVGAPREPKIVASSAAVAAARRHVPDGVVVLVPGSGGAAKRVPLDAWEEVARTVGAPVVWVRGPVERGEAGWGAPCLDDLDIIGLIGLAAVCRAWLGVDSGPSHLARAVGARVGVVFTGATDPASWAPPGAVVFGPTTGPGDWARWAAS